MNYESMTVDEAAVAIEARGEAGQIESMHSAFRSGLAACSRRRMAAALKLAVLSEDTLEDFHQALDDAMTRHIKDLTGILVGWPAEFRQQCEEAIIDAGQNEVARMLATMQDGGHA
jgi:hypothetical protein